jgi:hypothetical protein
VIFYDFCLLPARVWRTSSCHIYLSEFHIHDGGLANEGSHWHGS